MGTKIASLSRRNHLMTGTEMPSQAIMTTLVLEEGGNQISV
jgi:hypothetical protein